METFSALLAICAGNSPVPGEYPAQRPVTPSFDVFFDLRLNKWLSKQSWGWWFETPSHPLWRYRNGKSYIINQLVKSSPRQNGRHFADDSFNFIFANKSLAFWLKFHWSLFLGIQFTIPTIGVDNGLATNMREAITITNADSILWRIYATLGPDELRHDLPIVKNFDQKSV